jgi:hypothetical protein
MSFSFSSVEMCSKEIQNERNIVLDETRFHFLLNKIPEEHGLLSCNGV